MTDLVHVDQRKWPDREHYQLEARWLGRDRAGGWIHATPGTIVTRGDDEPWPLPGGFIALAPEEEWWVASFYPNHPELSVYVDIATPPEWDGSRLTFVDLNLVPCLITLARVRASQQRHPARTHDEGALARSLRRRTKLGALLAAVNPPNVVWRGTKCHLPARRHGRDHRPGRFEENRTTYGYPDEMVEGATKAADRAVALLRAAAEPFDETAEGWIQNAFGLE